jgi:hypothetical protein
VRAQDTSHAVETQLQVRHSLNALDAAADDEGVVHGTPAGTDQRNLAMVSAMQRQLGSNATTVRAEQDRLSMIERQIDSVQQGADSAMLATKGTPSETALRVQTLSRELADAQLSHRQAP